MKRVKSILRLVYQALSVSGCGFVCKCFICFVLFFAHASFVRAQERDSLRVYIHYPINRHIIFSDFADNAASLRLLNHWLEVTAPGDIRLLSITSASSPDGPVQANMLLSLKRGVAVKDYILARRPDLESRMQYFALGEAWEDLYSLDPSLPDLKEDEALLRALPKYRFIAREYFPKLRYTRVDFFPQVYAVSSWKSEGFLPAPTYSIIGSPVLRELESQNTTDAYRAVADNAIRPVFGISTNIPYDITYIPGYGVTSIPSLSLEYYPRRGHWTVGADAEFPMWRHPAQHRYMQVNNFTLWVRRYFKAVENRFKGTYLFLNANAARYGIGWNEKGWEGEGLGAGLGIGYKWTLGRRLFLDLGGSVGFFYSAYDPFVWGNDATGRYYYDYAGDPTQFVRRNKRLSWFGPTRLYISLGIDLFNRKR